MSSLITIYAIGLYVILYLLLGSYTLREALKITAMYAVYPLIIAIVVLMVVSLFWMLVVTCVWESV